MARRIDTEAEIDWIRLSDQGGDPASPAATYKYIYVKSGGLYLVNSAGTVVGPLKTVATDTVWDTAGDMVYATGADAASKLVIGTANQVLRVNAGATAPEWANVGRVLIEEKAPSGVATVSWASIPATYNSLEIEIMGRSDKAAVNDEYFQVFLNNDTTAANYRRNTQNSYGTTSATTQADDALGGFLPAASAPANSCGSTIIKINDYDNTTFNKMILSRGGYRFDAAGALYTVNYRIAIEWESTAAINRVDVTLATGPFTNGTKLRLYGVF